MVKIDSISPVVIQDSVYPVCYSQHTAILEFRSDSGLDKVICLQVNGCRGLILKQTHNNSVKRNI